MTDTINHYLCQSTTPPKPDAPLKVGDWVEWSGVGGKLDQFQKLVTFPAEINCIDKDGDCYIDGTCFHPYRLRRVPPPSTIAGPDRQYVCDLEKAVAESTPVGHMKLRFESVIDDCNFRITNQEIKLRRIRQKCRTSKKALVEARERIAELERQLADQAPLVYVIRMIHELHKLLLKLRDAKGGA